MNNATPYELAMIATALSVREQQKYTGLPGRVNGSPIQTLFPDAERLLDDAQAYVYHRQQELLKGADVRRQDSVFGRATT